MQFLLGVFAAVALTLPASAQGTSRGDAAHGRVIAETWCSNCHLVAQDENRTVLADIPPFTSIARRLPSDVDVLAAFIANPHPPMPDLGLSRQDIRDVLAYIATLK